MEPRQGEEGCTPGVGVAQNRVSESDPNEKGAHTWGNLTRVSEPELGEEGLPVGADWREVGELAQGKKEILLEGHKKCPYSQLF